MPELNHHMHLLKTTTSSCSVPPPQEEPREGVNHLVAHCQDRSHYKMTNNLPSRGDGHMLDTQTHRFFFSLRLLPGRVSVSHSDPSQYGLFFLSAIFPQTLLSTFSSRRKQSDLLPAALGCNTSFHAGVTGGPVSTSCVPARAAFWVR